jgi:predicted double-glycine peptidase
MSARSTYALLIATLAVIAGPIAAHAQRPGGRVPIRDPDHVFGQHVTSWYELRQYNIVMQRRDYSCGAAALATMARHYLGDPVTEDYFLNHLDTILTPAEVVDRIKNGLALADLRKVADKTGYEAVVTKLSFQQLAEAKVPLLVGIDEDGFKHFVVYRGTNFRWVFLADPIRGHIRMTPRQFVCVWQKNLALAISKPGRDIPECHGLSLTYRDLFWGETSDQLLRTQPQRQSVHEPRQIRN